MTNLKLVLRTYSTLRQMSPDDIALLETLRALNDNDRELLVEMMTEKPAGKKASKRSSKSLQSSTKSSRASGMAAQLNKQLSRRREQGRAGTTTGDDDELSVCQHRHASGQRCTEASDHNIHHLQTAVGYHPFELPVPAAPAPSSANGALSATERSTRRSAPPSRLESDDGESGNASSSTANSEASAASAHAATGGSSE